MTSRVLCIHQFCFYFFFCRCDLSTRDANVDEEKKEAEKIEEITTKAETKITIKTKRLLNLRQ